MYTEWQYTFGINSVQANVYTSLMVTCGSREGNEVGWRIKGIKENKIEDLLKYHLLSKADLTPSSRRWGAWFCPVDL